MYKPKPMTDMDLDKYIADLNARYEKDYIAAYKVPEPHLGILWAIAGGLMFSGSIFYLIWILYGVYEKIHGGIR